MGSYRLTSQADIDIEEIVEYIARDSLVAALDLEAQIEATFRMLADNPKAGREREELETGLRSFPEGNYVIFYRVWASDLLIVRVVHGARDIPEIFS